MLAKAILDIAIGASMFAGLMLVVLGVAWLRHKLFGWKPAGW